VVIAVPWFNLMFKCGDCHALGYCHILGMLLTYFLGGAVDLFYCFFIR
jgi:hypothetical protein